MITYFGYAKIPGVENPTGFLDIKNATEVKTPESFGYKESNKAHMEYILSNIEHVQKIREDFNEEDANEFKKIYGPDIVDFFSIGDLKKKVAI